ncbi:MAG: hypothetical protein J3K34DRAFT_36629 [Monoraphidium minutum]|nr:MAG: hypothetical protein J3K34DRAFT_36629 [Monoraphidium minutum]
MCVWCALRLGGQQPKDHGGREQRRRRSNRGATDLSTSKRLMTGRQPASPNTAMLVKACINSAYKKHMRHLLAWCCRRRTQRRGRGPERGLSGPCQVVIGGNRSGPPQARCKVRVGVSIRPRMRVRAWQQGGGGGAPGGAPPARRRAVPREVGRAQGGGARAPHTLAQPGGAGAQGGQGSGCGPAAAARRTGRGGSRVPSIVLLSCGVLLFRPEGGRPRGRGARRHRRGRPRPRSVFTRARHAVPARLKDGAAAPSRRKWAQERGARVRRRDETCKQSVGATDYGGRGPGSAQWEAA